MKNLLPKAMKILLDYVKAHYPTTVGQLKFQLAVTANQSKLKELFDTAAKTAGLVMRSLDNIVFVVEKEEEEAEEEGGV